MSELWTGLKVADRNSILDEAKRAVRSSQVEAPTHRDDYALQRIAEAIEALKEHKTK